MPISEVNGAGHRRAVVSVVALVTLPCLPSGRSISVCIRFALPVQAPQGDTTPSTEYYYSNRSPGLGQYCRLPVGGALGHAGRVRSGTRRVG